MMLAVAIGIGFRSNGARLASKAVRLLVWSFVVVVTNATMTASAMEPKTTNDDSWPITINGPYSKNCAKPEYPPESIEKREAGLAVVKFLLSADGIVIERQIERSSGVARLDEASKRALDLCKFPDQTATTIANQQWMRIEYLWELGNLRLGYATRDCAKPSYPSQSVREGESGMVSVAFLVDEQGSVTKSYIERSSGYRRLDEATQKAIALCKIAPALEGGRAIRVWSRVEYLWRMDGYNNKARVLFAFEAEPPMPEKQRPDWTNLLDKPYAELPQWERETFAAMFERTQPQDEPPFPAEGLGALYRPILEAQRRLRTNGMLSLFLTVSSDGDITRVDVFDTPNKAMKDFAAGLAVLTKFKPGTCSGVPCERGFPFRMRLESN